MQPLSAIGGDANASAIGADANASKRSAGPRAGETCLLGGWWFSSRAGRVQGAPGPQNRALITKYVRILGWRNAAIGSRCRKTPASYASAAWAMSPSKRSAVVLQA